MPSQIKARKCGTFNVNNYIIIIIQQKKIISVFLTKRCLLQRMVPMKKNEIQSLVVSSWSELVGKTIRIVLLQDYAKGGEQLRKQGVCIKLMLDHLNVINLKYSNSTAIDILS